MRAVVQGAAAEAPGALGAPAGAEVLKGIEGAFTYCYCPLMCLLDIYL